MSVEISLPREALVAARIVTDKRTVVAVRRAFMAEPVAVLRVEKNV